MSGYGRRPRLLDLFCGAGGCAVGYHRAGFEVVGVDLVEQPRYPFEFYRADALDFCRAHSREFDVIHASPPCQRYSISRNIHARRAAGEHPDLVGVTRSELDRSGRPWILENVGGAPLVRPVMLCGLMFGLQVLRHRFFESSHCLLARRHPKHPSGNLTNAGRGYSTGAEGFVCVAGNNFSRVAGASAMGVHWPMTRTELAQAIPPAYTEFLGRQLLFVSSGKGGEQ